MHTVVHCLFDREVGAMVSLKTICEIYLWFVGMLTLSEAVTPPTLDAGGPNQSLFITNFLKQSIKMSGKSKEQQLPDIWRLSLFVKAAYASSS